MSTLSDILTAMTSFISNTNGLIAWMGSFLDFVVENPILVVFIFMALVRGVIGIVRRWLPGRV